MENTNKIPNKLEKLRKVTLFHIFLIIFVAVIALIFISNIQSTGYGKGIISILSIITLGPLLLFYTLLYVLLAVASNKNKTATNATFYTFSFLIYSPWVLLLMVTLINSYKDRVKHEVFTHQKYFVDKARFLEGRPCAEIAFKCLPENKNNDFSNNSQSDKDSLEYFTITPEVLSRQKQVFQDWDKNLEDDPNNPNAVSAENKQFIERIEQKELLEKMEQKIEKQFPNYWSNTDTVIRQRWLRLAMEKSIKLGLDAPYDLRDFIQLCARIGLNFDTNSKWKPLAYYLSYTGENSGGLGRAGDALNYFDFSVLGKTENSDGYKIDPYRQLYKLYRFLPRPP